jgi:hypothetical protein
MRRRTIRILKYVYLAIYLLIGIGVLVLGIKHGPPLVPLDAEGHTAPYYETPGSVF